VLYPVFGDEGNHLHQLIRVYFDIHFQFSCSHVTLIKSTLQALVHHRIPSPLRCVCVCRACSQLIMPETSRGSSTRSKGGYPQAYRRVPSSDVPNATPTPSPVNLTDANRLMGGVIFLGSSVIATVACW